MLNVNRTGQVYLLSLQRRKTLRISSSMLVLVLVALHLLLLLLQLLVVLLQLLLLQKKRRRSPRKRVMMIWDLAYSIRRPFIGLCLSRAIIVNKKRLRSARVIPSGKENSMPYQVISWPLAIAKQPIVLSLCCVGLDVLLRVGMLFLVYCFFLRGGGTVLDLVHAWLRVWVLRVFPSFQFR